MKLMNVCAALALSGLFAMASQAMVVDNPMYHPMMRLSRDRHCHTAYDQCISAGRAPEKCKTERDQCVAATMRGKDLLN